MSSAHEAEIKYDTKVLHEELSHSTNNQGIRFKACQKKIRSPDQI